MIFFFQVFLSVLIAVYVAIVYFTLGSESTLYNYTAVIWEITQLLGPLFIQLTILNIKANAMIIHSEH